MDDSTLSDADVSSYWALRNDTAWAPTQPAACLEFSGRDAAEWLHGQTSQDLRDFPAGEVRSTCFLSATGQIRSIVALAALPSRFIATLPEETASFVMETVQRTVFLEEVNVRRVSMELAMILGPRSTDRLREAGFNVSADAFEWESGYGFRPAPLRGGWLIWHLPGNTRVEEMRARDRQATVAATAALRLEYGIPVWGRDADEKTLPPELGPEFLLQNVSYSKGCYLGQEVLMRIRSRGHTNRTWVGLAGAVPFRAGSRLLAEDAHTLAGTVTSGGLSPERGFIGAAILKNEYAGQGTRLMLETADGLEVVVVRVLPMIPA